MILPEVVSGMSGLSDDEVMREAFMPPVALREVPQAQHGPTAFNPNFIFRHPSPPTPTQAPRPGNQPHFTSIPIPWSPAYIQADHGYANPIHTNIPPVQLAPPSPPHRLTSFTGIGQAALAQDSSLPSTPARLDKNGSSSTIFPPTPFPFASKDLPHSGLTHALDGWSSDTLTPNIERTPKAPLNQPFPSTGNNPAKNLDQYTAFWEAYNKEADKQDRELVSSLSGDLDVLLIFAGLFSAINTAFIIEAYRDLKTDPADTTNELLRALLQNLHNPLATEIPAPPLFSATKRAVRVNALFFASLCCSMFAAFGSVIGKQWVTNYEREGQLRSLPERGRIRHRKYMGLKWWHLIGIVETLPTLLQLSLFFFFAALIDFIWPMNVTVAAVIITFSVLSFLFYVTTTSIATIFPDSPFQTRFSALAHRLLHPMFKTFDIGKSSFPHMKLDTVGNQCIKWLLETTTVQDTITIASKALMMLSDEAREEINLGVTSSILQHLFRPSVVNEKVEISISIEDLVPSLEDLSRIISHWDQTTQLVLPDKQSDALFMGALRAEILKVFVMDSTDALARDHAADILKQIGTDNGTPTANVDGLFLHCLRQSLNRLVGDPEEYLYDFRTIVGALVTLHQSLPLEQLSKLIRIPEKRIFSTLSKINVLISVYRFSDGHRIQIIHHSFLNFITQEDRCIDTTFLLSPKEHHSDLASNCLQWMISNLKSSVSNLSTETESSSKARESGYFNSGVPPYLSYACCYWAFHLEKCDGRDSELHELLPEFCKGMISYWLEALSHLKRLDVATRSLEITQEWLKAQKNSDGTPPNTNILTLLETVGRFIADFYDQISAQPAVGHYWENFLANTSSMVDGDPDNCTMGTRAGVRNKLQEWINDRESEPFMIVLQGAIGSGKSAIAQTIMEHLRANSLLGASLFIRRSNPQPIQHPVQILSILASQLARHYVGHRQQISKLLQDVDTANSDEARSSVMERLLKVVGEALVDKSFDQTLQYLVVIMDGLDELTDMDGIREIIQLFMFSDQPPLPIKVLITTRPESTFLSMLDSVNKSYNDIEVVDLDDNPSSEIDIQQILQFHLWNIDPYGTQVTRLSPRVGSSYGLAKAVSSHLIQYPLPSDMNQFFQDFVSADPTSMTRVAHVYQHIDEVYLMALQKLIRGRHSHPLGIDMLASITLLFDTFSAKILSDFLNWPTKTVSEVITTLRSFVQVQRTPYQGIQLRHWSLASFLTNRCTDPLICFTITSHHSYLGKLCLDNMNKFLKRDMCGLNQGSRLNGEVVGLQKSVEDGVPYHIRYSCYHWASHFGYASADDPALMNSLEEFCTTKLLNWLEILSLFGRLSLAEPALHRAETWLKETSPPGSDLLVDLLQDCQKMVNEFFVPVSLHTPQVYESVLLLHPSRALYQNYHVELKKESTLEAQETRASFPVIISHNGYTALSAKVEGDVCSLQLFDTETWSMKAKFETRDQISPVPSVMTLSLDGTKVAFATRNPDHPVVVWDTLWQDSLKNLLGHSDTVRYIEFIPNSTRVVSGSDDRTLRVWDWVEGTSVSTLIGHTDSINVVTLSPDGGYIVSGSNDKTIRVWVLVLKEIAMVLEGHSHPVTCAAVSPDSRILVSGDQSGYMLLWDFKKGTILRACSASTNGPTRAISFSPDSGRMVFWSSMSVGYDELSDTLPVRYPRAGSDKLIFWRDDWIWELNSFGCLKRFWLPSYWYRADPASGRPHRNSFVMRGREDHDDLIIVDCRAGFSFTDPVSISQLVQNEGLSQLEDMRVLSQWPTMDPILTELPSSSLEDFTSHESKIAEKPNSDVVHPIPPLRYNLIGLTMEYPQPEAVPSTKNT